MRKTVIDIIKYYCQNELTLPEVQVLYYTLISSETEIETKIDFLEMLIDLFNVYM